MKSSGRSKPRRPISAIYGTLRIVPGGGAVITAMIALEAVAEPGLAKGKTPWAVVMLADVTVAAE